MRASLDPETTEISSSLTALFEKQHHVEPITFKRI